MLTGLCPSLAAYEGTYTLQGMAANGAPYYSNGAGKWLYYDLDCDGNGRPARWILDVSAPDGSRSSDLDNDGRCLYGGDHITVDAQS